ncbi:MAG TPA: 16S rRNA (guanine(527)-N(7))-methyltransferase RsmG [Telmatospirillum sp.]|nr:16S rRNA (guanine(527)-N(7))-methyltransferase RsmG [Telmatospirillum sp.]
MDPGASFSKESFAAAFPTLPEDLNRLSTYADVLVKWQARINLVGPSTVGDLWRRHMLDSAQLARVIPPGPVLDLGSGAGFPGLVLAILRGGSVEDAVHLVESDSRKCAFLREVIRLTAANAVVHNVRIETLAFFPVVAVTARALASLSKLLEMSEKFLLPSVHCYFLKGRSGEEELTEARKDWMMAVERMPSLADPSGLILHLREVYRGRDER